MDWSAFAGIASAAAVLVALWAVRYARRSSNAAVEQYRLAAQQTELQRQVIRDAAQPYVWADVQLDDQQGWLSLLVVRNEGPTVATKVRVTFDPEPTATAGRREEGFSDVLIRLRQGLDSLAPRQQRTWLMSAGPGLFEGEPLRFTVSVDADGPAGPCPTNHYVIDLEDMRWSGDRPTGSLHHIRNAVEDVSKEVKKLGADIRRR